MANHDGEPNSIELKYLVKRHTFMRRNAIYGAIGNKLKKKEDVHDWNDLETLVESATKTSNASTLTPLQNIYQFLDLHKKNLNFPKLSYRKSLQVRIKCLTKYL